MIIIIVAQLIIAIISTISMNALSSTITSKNIRSFIKNHVRLKKELRRFEESSPLRRTLNLYLGNEAADADSIISALCYSYLKYSIHEANKDSNDKSEYYFLPLICIDRNELSLRRDTEILLKGINIELSELLCLDDMKSFFGPSKAYDEIQMTLLDHNSLCDKARNSIFDKKNFGKELLINVHEIIDHHEDLKMHLDTCRSEKRNIAYDPMVSKALVGSACTLVYEKYKEEALQFLDSDVATLLMGVITLDTLDMDEKADKGTKRDLDALNELQTITTVNKRSLFEELRDCKNDISFWNSLSAFDCLRLDYKLFTSASNVKIGISSVLMPLDSFLETKSDLIKSVNNYFNCENINILVIMGFTLTPSPTRELIIILKSQSENDKEINQLIDNLNNNNLDLQLLTISQEKEKDFQNEKLMLKCFSQKNTKMSRKQLAPVLLKLYE